MTSYSGGCQCGAIRFRVEGEPERVSVCHCRMCQKATGGPFQIVAIVKYDDLTWTRGAMSHFRSSSTAERGFCNMCGTPMSFEWGGKSLGLAIGTFDDPRRFSIDTELSRETRLPCLSRLGEAEEAGMAASDAEAAEYAAMANFQHPDHDTETWPQGDEK